MNKKYVVKLTEAERTGLQKLIATGKAAACKLLLARILLKVELGYVERVGRETVRQVLKNRAQALAQGAVMHSPQSECGICL